jgi:hypothetical protein
LPGPHEKLAASPLGEVSKDAHFLIADRLPADDGGDGFDPPAGKGIFEIGGEGNRYQVLFGRPPFGLERFGSQGHETLSFGKYHRVVTNIPRGVRRVRNKRQASTV